jgi:hypothetical protein
MSRLRSKESRRADQNKVMSQQPDTSWTQGETQLMSRSRSEESRRAYQDKVMPVLASSGTRVGLKARPSSCPSRYLKSQDTRTKTK